MLSAKRILSILWDYGIVTVATVIYCLGWTSFLIPNGIASGGGTGLCTIIYFATGIPVAYSFFTLNAILLILGFLVLGKSFGFKTIYVILLSSVLFDILPRFDELVVHFDEKFIVAVVGGILESVGIGLILLRGGSSGGTDIAAMIINKYWPVSPGKVYLYSDLFIIASILLIPGKTLEDMIYGYITMVTFSVMIDMVLLGRKSSVQILVFSPNYKDVAVVIYQDLQTLESKWPTGTCLEMFPDYVWENALELLFGRISQRRSQAVTVLVPAHLKIGDTA